MGDTSQKRTSLVNGVLLLIYIISGALNPIVLEYIKQQGAAPPDSLLFSIPNSVAMSLLLFVPQKESRITFIEKFWKQALLMTFIDVAGTSLTLFGQILCGSGIYIVIYSSLTVWSAIGSRIMMKKHFNIWQIIGIVVVTLGLAVSGVASLDEGSSIIIGVCITLVGTIFHSAVYWLNEFFNFKYTVNLQIMCGYTGVGGILLYLIYECVYTIPRWE